MYKAVLLNVPCAVMMLVAFVLIAVDFVLVFRLYHTREVIEMLREKDEVKYAQNSYVLEGNKVNWHKLSVA